MWTQLQGDTPLELRVAWGHTSYELWVFRLGVRNVPMPGVNVPFKLPIEFNMKTHKFSCGFRKLTNWQKHPLLKTLLKLALVCP